MSLKTRLDGRSCDNDRLVIKNADGQVIVEIQLADQSGSTLNIDTAEGLYIEKPSGWNSKDKE